jgi:hypothetical protein
MLQESVFVEYTMERDVFVDGTLAGTTNQLMTVETGTHTFDLGKPATYSPKSVTKLVYGTSPLAPCVITFTPEL